jgi:CRP-like cAMP-binding protein
MDFSTLFMHETDTVRFSPGSSILKRGEPSNVMYVLLDGEAEIRLGGSVVELARAGALLGELALIDHSPGSADVVARTDCRLVAIDERRFRFLVQQTPHFALDVMKVIADRLRAMNARLASITG